MPRFSSIKNSFLAGEMSPKVQGRTDLPQYAHGAQKLENMLVMVQGGATRRPGTKFIGNVTGSNVNPLYGVRLIPFVYSQTESYIVELACTTPSSPGTIQIWPNQGSTSNSPTVIGGAVAYTKAQLPDIKFCQSADTLYLVHPSVPPQKIVRTSVNTFELRPYDYNTSSTYYTWNGRPYRDPNIDTTLTLTPSATTGTVTLTASSALFDPNHVNSYWKISHTGVTGAFMITVVNSPTSATATVVGGATLGGTTATSDWEEGSWSLYRGYPRTVCFFQDRLIFGGNLSQPDTIWFSRQSNYYWMNSRKFEQDATVYDNTIAFSRTLNSSQVNQIQWMVPSKTLTVGTTGTEYILQSADPTQAINPNSFSASAESSHGSSSVQGLRAGYFTMFCQRTSRTIRELQYDFYSTQYVANNMSLLSDHLPGKISGVPSPITQLQYQNGRQILWCIDSAGGLFGMTREKQQGVQAWQSYIPGGKLGPTGGTPQVLSICVVPSSDRMNDDLYMVVVRYINGNAAYTIETMGSDFERSTVTTGGSGSGLPFYLDCAKLRTLGGPGTAFDSFNHLANETVSVLADGFYVGEYVVSSGGVITLTNPATSIIAGYKYKSTIQTMRLESGSMLGTAQGQIKRVNRAIFRFWNTYAASFGTDPTRLETINFTPVAQPMNQVNPPFTGDKIVDVTSDYGTDGVLYVLTDIPMPMTVLAIIQQGVTDDL